MFVIFTNLALHVLSPIWGCWCVKAAGVVKVGDEDRFVVVGVVEGLEETIFAVVVVVVKGRELRD